MPSVPFWLRTREACLMATERLCSQVAADGVKISERNSGGASSQRAPEEAGKLQAQQDPRHTHHGPHTSVTRTPNEDRQDSREQVKAAAG